MPFMNGRTVSVLVPTFFFGRIFTGRFIKANPIIRDRALSRIKFILGEARSNLLETATNRCSTLDGVMAQEWREPSRRGNSLIE